MPSDTEVPAETETAVSAPQPAAVWARILAAILDWLIWLPPSAALIYLALRRTDLAPACIAAWLTGKAVYEILMHGYFGATLGKMLLRIRVERVDGAPMDLNAALRRGFVSAALSLSMAILAWRMLQGLALAPLPPFDSSTTQEALREPIEKLLGILVAHSGYRTLDQLTDIWWVSEWITCLSNARRRALHDFIGGTVVVKK
jgi:uncharacterized RDD family membrane protein YckC